MAPRTHDPLAALARRLACELLAAACANDTPNMPLAGRLEAAAPAVLGPYLKPAQEEQGVVSCEKQDCARCGSEIWDDGRCEDETCPFSDHDQSCLAGWSGHPEKDPHPTDDTAPLPCTCSGRQKEDEN